ncbi:hypothetical protein Tco_0245526 [Tanacetum coccineum]
MGLLAHRTPPYTSTNTMCVGEEKPKPYWYGSIYDDVNKLFKVFWDSALETVARYSEYVSNLRRLKRHLRNDFHMEEFPNVGSIFKRCPTPAELKRCKVFHMPGVGSIYVCCGRCNSPMMLRSRSVHNKRFNRIQSRVSCYTDAGYLTDADDLKSQTGYVFVLNGGAVDWKECKQAIFATSSAESRVYMWLAFVASKEAVWVRKFISGLGVVPTIEKPISMYCDNTGAIAIANDVGTLKGARHFRAKVHYLAKLLNW